MAKPNRASGYTAGQVDVVRATCLYIATKLGDLADETVIVGGLVPSLLVDQAKVGGADHRHAGTLRRRSQSREAGLLALPHVRRQGRHPAT